jgi:hypothetical protein
MAKEFFATSLDYLAKDQFAERLFLEIGTFGRSLVYGLIKEDIAHLVETRARNETVLQIRFKYRLI